MVVTDTRSGSPDGTDTLSGISQLAFSDQLVNLIVGTAGNDTLVGTAGTDFFVGGPGNHTLIGNGGADTAFFSGSFANYALALNGAGALVVTDTRSGSPDGTDTLSGISRLAFADQTVHVISGTSGADTLTADGSTDLFVGGAGNDRIIGNGSTGFSAKFFALPFSPLHLSDINWNAAPSYTTTVAQISGTPDSVWAASPHVNYAADYTANLSIAAAGTYAFSLNSDDGSALYIDGALVVNDDGAHGAVTVTNQATLTAGTHTVEVRFFQAGGGQTLTLSAPTGANAFMPPPSTAVYSGASSNYSFAADAANDLIVTDTRSGSPDGTDTLSGITKLAFTDQTVNVFTGASGADTLVGTSGNDIFVGGTGNDTLIGGGGNDTYEFNANYGQDVIVNGTSTSAAPSGQLAFGAGLDPAHLWLMQSGSDLQIDLLGTTSKVTVSGWFSNPGSQVQDITAGGLTLDAQIARLVAAMATYSSSNSGFDPTHATQMPNDPNLQAAIASAWHH
jgi:Ca2+-binding RTX toxin-like protein